MGAIAERIMQAMKTTGTTYVDLAKRTGVSKSALHMPQERQRKFLWIESR